MVSIYTSFFLASESSLQYHTWETGDEINSEGIKDENGNREDDEENLVSACEEADLEESTYDTETDETTETETEEEDC